MSNPSIYEELGKSVQDCECEKMSQSSHSPGLVQADERLARLVFNPIHIDEAGAITPDAFQDVIEHGLSVNRLIHVSGDVHALGEQKAAQDRDKGKDRTYEGYVDALCADVREYRQEDEKIFCTIDTALEENSAHADIIHNVTAGLSKSKKKEIKRSLWELFGQQIQRKHAKH